jgi:anti-anti-sigma regulatory factor
VEHHVVQVVAELDFQDAAELIWLVPLVRDNDPVVVLLLTVVDVDSAGLLEQVAVSQDVAEQLFWDLVMPN